MKDAQAKLKRVMCCAKLEGYVVLVVLCVLAIGGPLTWSNVQKSGFMYPHVLVRDHCISL